MTWTAYQVILRLESPLHVGWLKVSYLQRTRPYVTGRVLRGALVTRIGRNQPELLSDKPLDPYRRISKTLAQYMAFTYFYPTLAKDGGFEACFPWEDEARFRRRFLSSYVSTALEYPQQSAAEGLLHEVEYIAPTTLDSGEPVYLMGYVFVDEEGLKPEKYDWQAALEHLQLGGERGYGWGRVRLAEPIRQPFTGPLFGKVAFTAESRYPLLHLEKGERVLAHVKGADGTLAGPVEPMVGREWRTDNKDSRKHIGQHLAYNGVLYAPGSVVQRNADFILGEGGYWEMIPEPKEAQP
jgi:hypothetical protein